MTEHGEPDDKAKVGEMEDRLDQLEQTIKDAEQRAKSDGALHDGEQEQPEGFGSEPA